MCSLLTGALLVACAAQVCGEAVPSSRYVFYRNMGSNLPLASKSRRVFGGRGAELSMYPPACVLLDRYWTVRCSGAAVASRWVLTAAHCVSPHIAYVKYNTRLPSAPNGDLVAVHYLYRHPGFKVVQEDEGRGMDVTLLHHDIGLVRTRADMKLLNQPAVDPLGSLRLYNPVDLHNDEVKVLGFGRTEVMSQGEELFEVDLQLVSCERGTWFYCMCGFASMKAKREARGVCSGDSGGPVLYRGAQVGVTSMGPTECSSNNEMPPETATSVFTSLYNYADVVNATIWDTEAALRMKMIKDSSTAPHTDLVMFVCALFTSLTLSLVY